MTLPFVGLTLHAWECLRYPPKQLFHIVPNFRTGFNEHQAISLGLLLTLCRCDLSLVVQIRLIAHEDDYHIVAPFPSNIVHPFTRVLE